MNTKPKLTSDKQICNEDKPLILKEQVQTNQPSNTACPTDKVTPAAIKNYLQSITSANENDGVSPEAVKKGKEILANWKDLTDDEVDTIMQRAIKKQ